MFMYKDAFNVVSLLHEEVMKRILQVVKYEKRKMLKVEGTRYKLQNGTAS